MQLIKSTSLLAALVMAFSFAASPVHAEGKKKTYNEVEFLQAFSGKSRKVITDKLGQPARKEQSVKPTNANSIVGTMGKEMDKSKPVNVEMWYYNNVVNYEPKKTYKYTELTFVNDRCMNIAFFNNK